MNICFYCSDNASRDISCDWLVHSFIVCKWCVCVCIYMYPLSFLCQSLQMVSGFLSVGVGILCAVTQQMDQSLFTLFRVSHFTGVLVRLCSTSLKKHMH